MAAELRRAPCTRAGHHAYLGGLLEHTVSVGTLVGEVCQLHPKLDSDLLMAAALLHDIGKIAIPDSILQKPGPLSPEEWDFMRQHTILGERILSAAPSLAALGKVVRATHERWDGGGYPDGLAGEEIPLAARIIFAADAYDAITTERPYAEQRTPAEAIAELRRCSGTCFDPDVVEAVVEAAEEVRERAEQSERKPVSSAAGAVSTVG